MVQRNPLLDYDIRDFVIVTDGIEGTESELEVLKFLSELLRENGYRSAGFHRFSDEELRERSNLWSQWDKEQFDANFDAVSEPISLETLLRYSEESNPEFHRILQERKLPLKEILWQEYQKRLGEPSSLHISAEHYNMSEGVAAAYPESHVINALFHHKVIAPVVQGPTKFEYHYVGRGFYGYGLNLPINPEIGREGRNKLTIPLVLVSDRDVETQKAFIRHVFNHEWIGHVNLALDDHFDIPSDQCLMVPDPSLNRLLENAKLNRGLYFCDSCSGKLGYKPPTLS